MSRVLKEILGLFVDDGAMALGIIIWVALMGVVGSLSLPALSLDMLLLVGLCTVLAYGVLRARAN